MHRTPIKLRNSTLSQQTKESNKRKKGKPSNLNITFKLDVPVLDANKNDSSNDVSTNCMTLDEMISSQFPMNFNKDDLKKISSDDKILLVLDRTAQVIKSYEGIDKTVIQYQKVITELMNDNKILKSENQEIKEKLMNQNRIIQLLQKYQIIMK